jgi:hypothetical protein
MRRLPRLLPALLLAAALLAGCSGDMFDSECDLVVLNDSVCTVTIFVDGREAFEVRGGSDRTLDDIGPGRHVLEALDEHGRLVERRTIELTNGEDYYWIFDNC